MSSSCLGISLKSDRNIVISWLENGLDVESLQQNIAKVIELKAKPKEITLHLDAE
jgi:hypothetical protein